MLTDAFDSHSARNNGVHSLGINFQNVALTFLGILQIILLPFIQIIDVVEGVSCILWERGLNQFFQRSRRSAFTAEKSGIG